MSFIKTDNTARVFAPGYFLAADAENCTRETREMKQTDATTLSDGTKIVKMGTAYPANDGTAEGIVYEDIDVTSGNMPGSVVTKGIVYEDRLAITSVDYQTVTPETGDNPKEKGWYERSGSAGSYVYTLTDDTTVQDGTTYYKAVDVRMSAAAKTALEGKGFKFIATAPTVTRPY
jgi:hypothetical protein